MTWSKKEINDLHYATTKAIYYALLVTSRTGVSSIGRSTLSRNTGKTNTKIAQSSAMNAKTGSGRHMTKRPIPRNTNRKVSMSETLFHNLLEQSHLLSSFFSFLCSTILFGVLLYSVSSLILSSCKGAVILFSPSDSPPLSCLQSSRTTLCFLREHMVPGLCPPQSLLSLPFYLKITTASPGQLLTLTATSVHNPSDPELKLSVDDLEISKPNMCNKGQVDVVNYGMEGFTTPLSSFSSVHLIRALKDVPGLTTRPGVPLMLKTARSPKNGYGLVSLAVWLKYQPEFVSPNDAMVFASTDHSIFTGALDYEIKMWFPAASPDLLFSHKYVIKSPTGTVLPTLVQVQHLIVIHGVGPGSLSAIRSGSGLFTINFVTVKDPDVVLNLCMAMVNRLETMHGGVDQMYNAGVGTGRQCSNIALAARSGLVGSAAELAEARARSRDEQ